MSTFHAFCLAAPRSGEGKTIVSIALMRLFARQGLQVQGFKCGPDYIDPSFHTEATGRPACNLDTWMMGHDGVQSLWQHRVQGVDIAICEGVMGLFDGRDVGTLTGSTADCALALDMPVVLVFNARGMAASVVALANGFYQYAKMQGVNILGLIANNVGSPRHAEILREALAKPPSALLPPLPPLLGTLPRNTAWQLPERQLGLLPADEIGVNADWLDALADEVEQHIDITKLLELTTRAPYTPRANAPQEITSNATSQRRMGIAKDHAFCFYYEENERKLLRDGWALIPFSPLNDACIPPHIDALYLGGGYPEVFARELSNNTSMRKSIKAFAEQGGEIYAECGGYMYLCTSLEVAQTPDTEHKVAAYPLCNVIDATARMGTRIRSLGYREVSLLGTAPLGLAETRFRGHEFHWSDITLHREYNPLYAVETRVGIEHTGVVYKNVRAGYVHLYWGYGSHASPVSIQAPAPYTQDPAPPVPNHTQNSGQLILLNGPSSVGKTSLAKALQAQCHIKYGKACMILSVDTLLRASTGAHESVLFGTAQTGLPFIETFHASLATATQAGALVIADHVIGEDQAWIDDLMARLDSAHGGDTPLVSVQLTCDLDILQKRERERTDRTPDVEHATRQAKTIHKPLPNQIYIDTTKATPEDCAMQILETLPSLLNKVTS